MNNEEIAREILDDLLSSLEALDTQCTAILQFLADKGIANDEELAGHLERAKNASNVRWRAARVRIDHLLSAAMKAAAEQDSSESAKDTEKRALNAPPDKSPKGESERQTRDTGQVASGKSEEEDVNDSAENKRHQEKDKKSKSPENSVKA